MIIGLVGGTYQIRKNITEQVKEFCNDNLIIFPFTRSLDAHDWCRSEALDKAISPLSKSKILLITNLITSDDVKVVRSRSGIIWHCNSCLSPEVEIEKHDILVRPSFISGGHYLDAESALSESALLSLTN